MVIKKERLGVDGISIIIEDDIRRILSTQYQKGVGPVCWYESGDSEKKKVKIVAIGTGWDMDDMLDDAKYIGTVQDIMGFVWHYYAFEVE